MRARREALIVRKVRPMKTYVRKLVRLGAVGVATVALSVVAMPAAYALTWYSSVPTSATSVATPKSYDTGHGILQIRTGWHGGKKYIWGRIASPDSTYNSGWDLRFGVQADSDCTVNGQHTGYESRGKDIDRTTYTPALRFYVQCHYYVKVEERNGPGIVRFEYVPG
jgi:hypothetical protein